MQTGTRAAALALLLAAFARVSTSFARAASFANSSDSAIPAPSPPLLNAARAIFESTRRQLWRSLDAGWVTGRHAFLVIGARPAGGGNPEPWITAARSTRSGATCRDPPSHGEAGRAEVEPYLRREPTGA